VQVEEQYHDKISNRLTALGNLMMTTTTTMMVMWT